MTQENTDEEIISRYTSGDQGAFKELVDRYTTPLFNFSARLTNKNNAPDIVQEVFIKAWKNLAKFDAQKASFKTWLFTIAKNTTTDFLRKKRSFLFSDIGKVGDEDIDSFAENIPDEKALPDEVIQKLHDDKDLDEKLNRLSTNYREILVLHYQEEMTFQEISKILNKPLNTVKSQHRRAIIELRKMVD